jgi:putative transposase
MRKLLNAILYVTRGGIAWRLLPVNFLPWQTVRLFSPLDGKRYLDALHDALRDRTRRKAGRKEQPAAACLDSQSVKTTALAGEKGFDAGKKIQGRKRHLRVDTLGLVLVVVVTAASVQDREGAKLGLQALSDSCKQVRLVGSMGGIAADCRIGCWSGLNSCSKLSCAPIPRKASGCSPGAGSWSALF